MHLAVFSLSTTIELCGDMRPHLSIFNYAIHNQGDNAEIHIDGYIVDAPKQDILKAEWNDETSVSYKSFRDQLTVSNYKNIDVYINSCGGHVGDAMAIHDLLVDLQNKGVTVNTHGRGIIASAATYILMAGRNSSMSANSWFMIHNVSGVAVGDVNQIENQARTMRKFNNFIRDFYAESTTLPSETVAAMMNKETYLSAKEAKEKGFIKNITGEVNFKNAIAPESWPYANLQVLNAYNQFTAPHTTNTMVDKIIQGVTQAFQKLNLIKKENATHQELQNVMVDEKKLTAALEETLAPLQQEINSHIDNTVELKMKTVDEQITNAVKGYLDSNLSNHTALKNITAEVEQIKKDIANKITGSAQPKLKDTATVSKYDHPDIKWGN